MGKHTSKLYKNRNNTDILFYQIYLQKLYEHNLKYNSLNSFKEIAISFNNCLQTISESLASFPEIFLFKLINAAIIFAFSLSLVWHSVLLANCSSPKMIKGVAIWGVEQPD